MITNEEIERRLGYLVDSALSVTCWITSPLPPGICLEALSSMLPELTKELRSLYVDIVGSDPWADHPREIQP